MNIEKLISKIEKEQEASYLWIKSSYVLMHIKTPEQMNELNDIVQGVYDFIIDEYLKKSVVNESFTTEKINDNDPKDLINWVELSRHLAGNESSVSRNRIPKKYQPKVNRLVELIEQWQNETVSDDG